MLNLNASAFSPDEKNKPGDDKKSKAKREDTTKMVMNLEPIADLEGEETDTTEISFPSHDLYASWDTNTAHPYNFSESFKEDSVTIILTQGEDNCFVLPYKGGLTSLFGWRKYRPHYGTDIDLETGDSVLACFDGMVRVAKYYRGYGNCVIIRHKNGLETVYGHMSKLLVESGQELSAGTLIGLGGNTGHSYGSHLHFEIRYLGQALDTQDFIDYEKGDLKSNSFVLRKSDVTSKYDLRALHTRHKNDLMARKYGSRYPAKGGVYRVRSGDTLGAIAKRSGTSIKSLCKKNGLRPTSTLRIGQRLKI
ncbi:peptidoglycan DD-metalloendopeptidase family protein [Aurantibacillus circumpalustris]|uniref:peptidoglycan DD-metalloendopeptidase family protein n=1 Tax=Aurantibacillus circumpalustris TaxID=3036359 RepID=UPI00295AAB16|nr:peptidoglycan DD-metalloendopeptidase family protein [Aurantibacillus circumpalustris]